MADVQIDQDAANIPAVNVVDQGSDPTAPGAGHVLLYVKSGVLYVRLSDGTVAAVGGVPSLPEGRLAIGDGDDLLSALALGSEGDVVTADSSGFATWAAPAASGGGDVVLIQDQVVDGSAPTSVTFSGIPNTYKHLRFECQARSNLAANPSQWVLLQLNGDSGANYTYQWAGFYYNSSVTGGVATATATCSIAQICAASATTNRASSFSVHIPSYAATSFFKNAFSVGGSIPAADGNTYQMQNVSVVWDSTAAITSVTFALGSGAGFVAGSRFTLYGLK